MADRAGLLYRPDIPEPVRDQINSAKTRIEEIPPEDIPASIALTYKQRFEELNHTAVLLKDRSKFLMDVVISDIDGYVGDANSTVLQYIHDLTGLVFHDGSNQPLPETDPVYTLSEDVIKCIFRTANYYENYSDNNELIQAVQNWDSGAFKNAVNKDLKGMGYFDAVNYGLKLLVMVVQICFVILVHYNVGYMCALIRRYLGWMKVPKKIKFKKYKIKVKWFKIGHEIANVFRKAENFLLGIVNFKCGEDDDIEPCSKEPWSEVGFRRITCCTTSPFFFTQSVSGKPVFNMTQCFEQWLNSELKPDPPRYICDDVNVDNTELEPTPEEMAKAKAVTDYLLENSSISGSTERSDIFTLRSSLAASNKAIGMTQDIQSVLDTSINYNRSSKSGPWYNCFGYSPGASDNNTNQQENMSRGHTKSADFVELGAFFQDYLNTLDESIVEILKYSDKIVTGVSNLTKWATTKQLCCYIYLMVVIASLFHSLITKGSICEDLDSENEDGFAQALRNELQYAQTLQKNANVEKFVTFLNLIKQIIDIYNRKMERALFMQGLVLPFGEMFDMIKLTLSNGLSSFLDILFGPLDMILTNIKAVPEFRHIMNNECFGFDKLLDFLSCSLGSLKYGILQEVINLLNQFRLNDVQVINDIYICRTRLEFLKALSRLLGIMADLIFGLRDCYDPRDVVNQVMDKQQKDMYSGVEDLQRLMGSKENMEYLDECSESLFGQNFLPDDDILQQLQSDPSRLSAMFGEIGPVGDTIIQSDLFCNTCTGPFKVSEFVNDNGELLSPAEFMKKAEEFSDVTLAEIEKDLTDIFDILRGSNV